MDLGDCSLEKDEYGLFDGFVLTQNENMWAVPNLGKLGATLAADRFTGVQTIDLEYVGPIAKDVVHEALAREFPATVMVKSHSRPCACVVAVMPSGRVPVAEPASRLATVELGQR